MSPGRPSSQLNEVRGVADPRQRGLGGLLTTRGGRRRGGSPPQGGGRAGDEVHGSSDLIQTLLRHGLIDEFRLWIFPVVLGRGTWLFGEGTLPAAFRLTGSDVSSTGVVMATFEPGGELDTGSFALQEPSEAEVRRREGLRDQ